MAGNIYFYLMVTPDDILRVITFTLPFFFLLKTDRNTKKSFLFLFWTLFDPFAISQEILCMWYSC